MTVLLIGLLLSGCSNFFFYPATRHLQSPSAYALPYEDVQLLADDGTQLHAWFLPATQKPKGSLLFLHGNAENVSTHIENIHWLPGAGYNVLLLDYRGFGLSHGVPKLPDVFWDINAAVDWMNRSVQTKEQPFFIIGQSIGASLMLHNAAQNAGNQHLCGLISDAAFARYRHIAAHIASQSWVTWPFHFPLFWRVYNQYDPVDGVAKLAETPILFFHSKDDQIIPFANLDRLVKNHPGYHQRVITSGRHTATFMSLSNRQIMLEFLSQQNCSS
ncbi:MAG: alpha/beta hydrolase [Porticoccaceae bacterium]|nr:alpha/beta hydrolase [Porticoccaceae bacterium]